jgi:hypothetical protein
MTWAHSLLVVISSLSNRQVLCWAKRKQAENLALMLLATKNWKMAIQSCAFSSQIGRRQHGIG